MKGSGSGTGVGDGGATGAVLAGGALAYIGTSLVDSAYSVYNMRISELAWVGEDSRLYAGGLALLDLTGIAPIIEAISGKSLGSGIFDPGIPENMGVPADHFLGHDFGNGVEIKTALAMVVVRMPYFKAITKGMAPQGPAAVKIILSAQMAGSTVKPVRTITKAGWITTFAATTDQVALPMGRRGPLASIIPKANSAVGAAAAPANLA